MFGCPIESNWTAVGGSITHAYVHKYTHLFKQIQQQKKDVHGHALPLLGPGQRHGQAEARRKRERLARRKRGEEGVVLCRVVVCVDRQVCEFVGGGIGVYASAPIQTIPNENKPDQTTNQSLNSHLRHRRRELLEARGHLLQGPAIHLHGALDPPARVPRQQVQERGLARAGGAVKARVGFVCWRGIEDRPTGPIHRPAVHAMEDPPTYLLTP